MQFSIIAVLRDVWLELLHVIWLELMLKTKQSLIKYHVFKCYETVSLTIAPVTWYSGGWKLYLHLQI